MKSSEKKKKTCTNNILPPKRFRVTSRGCCALCKYGYYEEASYVCIRGPVFDTGDMKVWIHVCDRYAKQ